MARTLLEISSNAQGISDKVGMVGLAVNAHVLEKSIHAWKPGALHILLLNNKLILSSSVYVQLGS